MDLAKLLDVMEVESRKRKAPVYELKSELRTPFHHLVAALLSSRTRDEITIQAAQRLLDLADSPEKLASMSVSEIEDLIKGVGFYRVKARRLKELATILVKRYNSKVPLQFEELIKLPGIGRKSANVVLAHLGHPAIAVDTHVHRVSNRIGLVKTKKP
ncbi:endonuclease III, partial [Archaeoglobales archaeon ex4484_92]